MNKMKMDKETVEKMLSEEDFDSSQIAIAQLDSKLYSLTEMVISTQSLISSIVRILYKSELSKDENVNGLIKVLYSVTDLIDSNTTKMREMMLLEKSLKMGNIKFFNSASDGNNVPEEKEENELAYG
jgi:hypothetical protein